MDKRPYHHGELRGALLDAAEELVREHGVAGWSLREASSRVGVSPSAAYHHFASREALVDALSVRVLSRLGQRMGDAAARATGEGCDDGPGADLGQGADPRRGLVAAGRAYVRWAVEDPAVARLAFGAGARSGARDPDARDVPHPHDVTDAELDRIAAAGALGPHGRPDAAFAVWAALHGLAVLVADGLIVLDGPQEAEQYAERLLRTVLTGLAHQPAPPGSRPEPRSAHTERRAARRDLGTGVDRP